MSGTVNTTTKPLLQQAQEWFTDMEKKPAALRKAVLEPWANELMSAFSAAKIKKAEHLTEAKVEEALHTVATKLNTSVDKLKDAMGKCPLKQGLKDLFGVGK